MPNNNWAWSERAQAFRYRLGGDWIEWNPLVDDGDALRLAVKLMLHIGVNPGNKVFCLPTYSDKPTVHESCERNGTQDPYAATRRAIVRAAAEIGKSQSKPLTTEEFTAWVKDTWNECQEKAWKEDKP